MLSAICFVEQYVTFRARRLLVYDNMFVKNQVMLVRLLYSIDGR
jgi:hypothetical protein